ncbi:MAG: PAS domain S-box protein [Adhaeribacter sp.]
MSALPASEAAGNFLQLASQLSGPETGLLVAAPDGHILAFNEKAQQQLPGLAAGAPLAALLPEAWQPQVQDFLCTLPQPAQATWLLPQAAGGYLRFTCAYVTLPGEALLSCQLQAMPASPAQAGNSLDSYQAIFDQVLESICILDAEGRILDVNQTALQYSNLPKDQVLGRKLGEVLEFNEFEETIFHKRLRQVLGGTQQKFDWWFKGANQELVTAEIIFKPGVFAGQEVVLAQAIDIYDLVHSEQNVRFRNKQLEFVNALLTKLARFQTTEEILQFTLGQLLEKTGTVGGGIYLFQEKDRCLTLLAAKGFQSEYLQAFATVELGPGLPELLNPEQGHQQVERLFMPLRQTLPVPSLVLLPIFSDQAFVGAFTLILKSPQKITASYTLLVESIANGIGQYITKHELNRQLSYSEGRYQVLFNASSDAIILSQGERILDFNRAVQHLGFPKDILQEQNLVSFLANGLAGEEDHLRELLSRTIRKGQEVVFEWKHWQDNRVVLETEISFNRVLIRSEFFIQTIIRDITQKKQALAARRKEEVLTESIRQFRELVSKVELAYVSVDREGTIQYVNNYFLNLLGYKAEELIGQNYFRLFVPAEEYENRLKGFQEVISTGILKNQYEREIRTSKGEVKTLIWQRMVEYDADGHIIGLNSLGRDVSDKKAAIEALRDNKSRLQDIFDNAHDLIQNISIDNKFIFVNKAWKEKLGYDDFDIEKLTLNDIVHPYYKAKLIYQLRNLYKGENVNKIETVFLTKAGKPVHLIGSINCTYQNGKPVASRAILHDITDRIKAERLQKVYYSIANLAISSKDLSSLYGAIHRELSKIIETNNIFIALTDDNKHKLNFVYFVDQFKDESKFVSERHFSNGISEYIINTGKPLFLLKPDILQLIEQGAITLMGTMPEVILCSPLAVGDRIIGVIAVQDYRKPDAYVSSDIEILHFISNQVALAIERKRNEVRINNQNARLKAIFESGNHLMWSINRQGRLTSFNQNFAQAYKMHVGHEPQLNEVIVQRRNPQEAGKWFEWSWNLQEAMAGQAQRFETPLRLDNQPERWQEVLLNPIYLEDNTFEEVSAMAIDITDKKRSQLAMAQSEEKFRSIFESFQDVFFRTDLSGRLTLVSPSAFEFLGVSVEELQGQPLVRLFQDPAAHASLLEKLDSQGKVRNFEARIRCRDKLVKDGLFNSSYVRDKEGHIVGIEGVLRDITDLKQIQDELIRAKELAEHSSQAKTQFLANMSHELRTPMNGIIGMIDLLYHGITSEEQREYVDTLRKSSDALLAILNDILDLSKIQAGKLVLNEGGLDLHYTVQKIYSLFINRAGQKDLALSYQITPHTPRFIISDETRLLQVLSNLTSNAIKFTNAGQVSILVNSIATDPAGYHTIMFQVKDSGIGITEADKKLLFTNFTQLDNSSTKSFGGTGLGLAISKQLSELLGGEIGVDSVLGEGSTFWFTIRCLPAINGAEILESQHQRDTEAEVQAFDFHPEVLLVDDNTINQKVAEQLLLRLGCRTDIASNGFQAIEKASAHRYDIIFMDIQMPEMDGVTATGHIKAVLGENCPPIVAMTAYSMKDDAEKFLSQGLDDYISKPVKANNLQAVIRRWLPQAASEKNSPAQEPTEISDIFIDENVIQQLQQLGGAEFARQLYEEFEEETEPLLAEARQQVAAKHYEQILSTLHQIKGTGFTLGLNSIGDTAKKLEHAIRQQDYTSVEADFAALLDHFEFFKKGYPNIFTPH